MAISTEPESDPPAPGWAKEPLIMRCDLLTNHPTPKPMTTSSSTLVIAALGYAAATSQAALIADSFDTDSSGNYTVIDDSNAASGDGTADGTVAFAFDYSTIGIPSAPRSTGGTTLGLRMTANDTANDAGAADHTTAFHNLVLSGSYRITVDMFMQVEAAGGTTEFAHIGFASDATDFLSIFTPVAGSGQFLAMTGDGGSSSDFRHFANGIPVAAGDASYLNSDNTTNATGDTYQSIFAGGDFPGSPGNRWTTLTIDVIEGGNVTYALDGTPIIQTPTESVSGRVGLGYADVFSSVGPHSVVYDNFEVEAIPEPSSSLMGLLGLASLIVRRKR